MVAELVLEATDIAVGVIERIVRAIIAARRFKKECKDLGNQVALLRGMLEKNKSALEKMDVPGYLTDCLSKCLVFVIQCQDWGRVSVLVEVVFRHRYPKLKGELNQWINYFNAETGVRPFCIGLTDRPKP
jgi:hypothetical protein